MNGSQQSDRSREEKCVQYVLRALKKNPLEQSDSIIRDRNRLLGLSPAVKAEKTRAPVVDPREQRKLLLNRLDAIRGDFWTRALPDLREAIRQIDASGFPDIQPVVSRLAIVAAQRDKIPRLIAHKDFDAEFLKVFREVLTSAPRDSAVAKERMIAQFGIKSVRKRGTKMIRLIQEHAPELYKLEDRWLGALVKQKNKPLVVQANDVQVSSEGFGIPWWSIFIVLGILRAVIRAMSGND
jgi:hypothetical protein